MSTEVLCTGVKPGGACSVSTEYLLYKELIIYKIEIREIIMFRLTKLNDMM